MKVLLTGLIVLGLFAVSVLWRAATTMCQEEIRTRLGQLPRALIWLAARRLPKELRSDLAAEWTAELEFMVAKTEGLPVTRFWRGLVYAGGLLRVAPSIGRELTGASRRLISMAGRLVTAGVITYGVVQQIVGAVHSFGGAHPLSGAAPAATALGGVALIIGALLDVQIDGLGAWLCLFGGTAFAIAQFWQGGWYIGLRIVPIMFGLAGFVVGRWLGHAQSNEPQSAHSDA